MTFPPLSMPALRRLAAAWACGCAGALLGSLSAPAAAALSGLTQTQLEEARDISGSDPARAQRLLAALREHSIAGGAEQAELRLLTDEVECRLLSDVDGQAGLALAERGLRAVAESPDPATASARARLRACYGGLLIDLGQQAAGEAELNATLAATSDPALAPGHALALLERGLHRARRGEYTTGQEDLLAACERLRVVGLRQDSELCLWHLANHQKRVGDLNEALRLFNELLDSARRRHARHDEGIALYSLGQVYERRKELEPALRSFMLDVAIETAKQDRAGIGYALTQVGSVLASMKRPADGLPYLLRAAQQFDASDGDPGWRVAVALAGVYNLLGRPAEAAQALRPVEAAVRARGGAPLLANWLGAQAEAQQRLQHWREAYEALHEQSRINETLQERRSSEQSERLRLAFNRERDAQALQALQKINAQGQRLRQAQAFALALFVVLLALTLAYAWRKWRQARRLQTLALVDELTLLPNRRAVLEQLAKVAAAAPRQASAVSVLMVDVDHFKRINDGHGHAVGDEVLRALASLMPGGLRPQDHLGRLGGEEFLVVLPATGAEPARAVAERVLQGVSATPLATSAGALPVSVSIGCATLHAGAETTTALLARADAALYRAKAEGRNRVVMAAG